MHHIHISTGFLFVISFFLVAILAVILSYIATSRRDRAIEKQRAAAAAYREKYAQAVDKAYPAYDKASYKPTEAEVDAFMPSTSRTVPPRSYGGGYGYVPSTPSPAHYAPAVAAGNNDAMLGLTTGMLLGSALGHGHSHGGTTIINNDSGHGHSTSSYSESSYSAPAPSSSYDGGFSYSDSSSSYDSGSSSGFDASW